MDVSSLPQSDQQQQQEAQFLEQTQYSPPQQQQQQHQIQYYYYYQQQPYSYDPSSYYSYYQQYPSQQQWQYHHHHHHQQQYPYYQHDYSTAYYQRQQQQQQPLYPHLHHDATPALSVPLQIPDSGGTGASSLEPPPLQQTQTAYTLPQSTVSVVVQPGMNPAASAAIAALEQLTQFAGTMDAAERAMAGVGPGPLRPPPDGRLSHQGGGRRGGRPFQGGGRGNAVHQLGSATPSRGRGRGRGKAHSRRLQPQGATSTSSHPIPSAAKEHSANGDEKAAQSASAPERVDPNIQPVQMAWCELCRVDCTSLEILEQHKNGKRHKKNLLRIEELKNVVKPGKEIQNGQDHINDSKPKENQQPQIVMDGEEQKSAANLPEVASDMENNLQNNTGKKLELPVVEPSDQQGRKPRMNLLENSRGGMKRKMKNGRGGKRMKISETHKPPVKPPKPKVVAPLICNLCNVKCDTREVLDKHYSGKKHIAKLKRFEGHQAMYGPTGLQALYPNNPIAQTHCVSEGHQPFYIHQTSFPPQGGYFSSQAHQSSLATASLDPQFSQSSVPQQSEGTSTFEANPAT